MKKLRKYTRTKNLLWTFFTAISVKYPYNKGEISVTIKLLGK